jgi:glycosyltransferase involved in cell wall biosynthesis
MPRVSVIIPTHNRLDRLKRVLAHLEQQCYPLDQFEVIVVSDGCSDGTEEYLRTLSTILHITTVAQPNRGVAAARNNGVAHATGDMILFLDDDVVPTPQLIAEHTRTHAEQTEDAVVLGPMLSPKNFALSPWVRWEQAMLTKQYHAMVTGKFAPTARQFYTGNTSLGRLHIIAAGGFDENFRRAEDVELAYRLEQHGLEFVFNPDAIGFHYAERSFDSWMEIPYVYGRNDVIFTREKKQDWLLPKVLLEFHYRNPLIKGLVQLCLDRYTMIHFTLACLKGLAYLADFLGIEPVTSAAYSGMFNLRYYQGIASELGGRERFFAQVTQAQLRHAHV